MNDVKYIGYADLDIYYVEFRTMPCTLCRRCSCP
jgi:hypothetical protein